MWDIDKWDQVQQNQQMTCAKSETSNQPAQLQSDQSLHCPPEEDFGPKLPVKHIVKTDQPSLSLYIPGIYAEGCIVFVFPFVCSFIRNFVPFME